MRAISIAIFLGSMVIAEAVKPAQNQKASKEVFVVFFFVWLGTTIAGI